MDSMLASSFNSLAPFHMIHQENKTTLKLHMGIGQEELKERNFSFSFLSLINSFINQEKAAALLATWQLLNKLSMHKCHLKESLGVNTP